MGCLDGGPEDVSVGRAAPLDDCRICSAVVVFVAHAEEAFELFKETFIG